MPRLAPLAVNLLVTSGLMAAAALTASGSTATATATATAPEGALGAPARTASTTTSTRGSFTSPCAYSHRLKDDPIVKPRQPGASHAHDFFGNRSTNAFSTASTLRSAATTCDRVKDTAAYWVPTMLNAGKALAARKMRVYYRTGGIRDPRTIRNIPAGLRVVAGNGSATTPQPLSITSWSCSVTGGQEKEVQRIPATCNDEPLRLKVVFPSCWNGKHLDSRDHKSHMAYSARGRCPATHPVPVPQVTLSLRYWIKGPLGRVRLSSGGTLSGHADFFNTWHQPTLNRLVDYCLRQSHSCGEAGVPAPVG